MNREVHARIWERPGVKLLRATRQALHFCDVRVMSDLPTASGHCTALVAISHAAAIPQPPVGRSNWHHSVQTNIGPAHSISPAGKRQYVVFLALVLSEKLRRRSAAYQRIAIAGSGALQIPGHYNRRRVCRLADGGAQLRGGLNANASSQRSIVKAGRLRSGASHRGPNDNFAVVVAQVVKTHPLLYRVCG